MNMRTIAWVSFLVLTVGCSEVPTSPNATSPSNLPAIVRGTVFETTPEGGRRPLAGALVNALTNGPEGGYGFMAYADAEGRYTFADLHRATTVLIHAMGGLDNVGFFRHQPCVAKAAINGDTRLDVEFNHKSMPGSGGPPLVSGVVFQTTSAGRQPVQNRRVIYYAPNVLGAYTFTDDNGRFEFCKVPLGPGKVFVTDPEDWDLGGPAAERTVNVQGNMVVDLEITK
jgi:hypothetical protein